MLETNELIQIVSSKERSQIVMMVLLPLDALVSTFARRVVVSNFRILLIWIGSYFVCILPTIVPMSFLIKGPGS